MNTFKIEEIVPAWGYVIVEPKETPKEVSGIYQPNKEQEVPQWGTVVAPGPLLEGQKAPNTGELMVGQTVIYKKWGGNDVEIGGKKYYFLKYEEIIGVVK